jgi:hypothetical protein
LVAAVVRILVAVTAASAPVRRPRGAQRAVVNGLSPAAATAIRADLDAGTALSRLDVPYKRLPSWRIEPPPASDTLLGYFKAAQASYGPRDMAGALLHYNPSQDYVRPVTDYAARMRADRRTHYGCYAWQVLYVRRGRLLLLPDGYPKLPPLGVTLPAEPRSG